MKFSEFIVEMDDMPPSEPQKVDKPVPTKQVEVKPNTQLKKPESEKAPEPQLIKKEANKFPDSPLMGQDGKMRSQRTAIESMPYFDPEKNLHQKKHYLADHDMLGYNMDRKILDDDFESLFDNPNYKKGDIYNWQEGLIEFWRKDGILSDMDEAFHEQMDHDAMRKEKIAELMSQGMDEDEAYDEAVDWVIDQQGAPESYFTRYTGFRNYTDVNNYLRHGMPDDVEWPFDGTLYELGWGNGASSHFFETKAPYPYYGEDEYDYDSENARDEAIEDYENEVAPLKSYAIAALVHTIKKMNQHIMEQPDMEPEMLYRGLHMGDHQSLLDSDPFENLQIGDIIQDPGFMSTSQSRERAEGFMTGMGNKEKGVLMEIFAGGKRKLIGGKEAEVVFPPLTQLKFLGQGDDGRYMFDQVGYDRNESITESKLQKPQIGNLTKPTSDAFTQRMSDLQFMKANDDTKIQMATPKQVEQFGNSPVRGVKPEDIGTFAQKRLDANSGRSGPRRGPYTRRELLHKNIHMDAFDWAYDPENQAEDQLDYLEDMQSSYVDARRDHMGGPAPRKGKPGREAWEKKRAEWYKNKNARWGDNPNGYDMESSSGLGISHELGSKIAEIQDGIDGGGEFAYRWWDNINPHWLNYSSTGAYGINPYLRENSTDSYDRLMESSDINDLGFDKFEEQDPELYEILKEAFILHNIENLHSGMHKSPKPQMYYRHLNGTHFDNLKEGDIIRDPGFMSTSRDRDVMETLYSNAQRLKDSTKMSVYGAGTIRNLNFHDTLLPMDESETVFAPNTPLIYRGRNAESGVHDFDILGYNRNDMTEQMQEQPNQLEESKKQVNLNGLQDRMNDFQFEVIRPKKFDDFASQLDHDD